MEIKFDKQYLEELYLEGKTSDKKHRFQPPIIGKYRKTIDLLESVLDVPADSLMRLQLKYNMQEVNNDKQFMERLRQIRQYAALL